MDPDKNWELGDDLTENDWDIISHSLNVDIQVNSSTRKYFKCESSDFTITLQFIITDKSSYGFYSKESNIKVPERNDYNVELGIENETVEKYKEEYELKKKRWKEGISELERHLEDEKRSSEDLRKNYEKIKEEFQRLANERNQTHVFMNRINNDAKKYKEKSMEELRKAKEDKEKFAKSFTILVKTYNEVMEKINFAISNGNEDNIFQLKEAVNGLSVQIKCIQTQYCPDDMSDEFTKLARSCFNFKADLLMNSSKTIKLPYKRDFDTNNCPQTYNRRVVCISYFIV